MICSQDTIRKLSLRIERAYCRRYPLWIAAGITPGVWESAANRLLEASRDTLSLPIDPEFYVAVQKMNGTNVDPWADLTQFRSLVRYRKASRKIIKQLRQELTTEISRGECRILRGVPLDQVLETEGDRMSPLSKYILAHRARRFDLSVKYHDSALTQHQSCPLYRLAARSLLPGHAYPSVEFVHESSSTGREIISFSRN